jgi:hypothetical protein
LNDVLSVAIIRPLTETAADPEHGLLAADAVAASVRALCPNVNEEAS